MPHAHENTLVICDSDSGKIAWSSVCWNIEKSTNLPSLRSLPTLTVACLSLVWPDLAWVDCSCQTRSGILAIFMSSNIRRTWWYSCIKLYGTLGSISGIRKYSGGSDLKRVHVELWFYHLYIFTPETVIILDQTIWLWFYHFFTVWCKQKCTIVFKMVIIISISYKKYKTVA